MARGRGDGGFQPTAMSLSAGPEATPATPRVLRIVAAFAIVSGLFLAATLWHLRNEAVRSGEQLTQVLAQVIAEQATRSMQTVEERLRMSAHHLQDMRDAGRLDNRTATEFLREQLQGLPHLRAIFVLDEAGRGLAGTEDVVVGQSLADRDYFQAHLRARDSAFFIGHAVRSRLREGLWVVGVSLPLRDGQGTLQGVVVAVIEPAHFESVWREIELGQGGSVALFHRSGQLMMRSPPDPGAIGGDFSRAGLFSRLLPASPEGSYVNTSSIDQVERMFAYRTLQLYPQLVVTVGSSMDHVLAPWRRFAALAGGVWLLAMFGATTLALQLQRQVARLRHLECRFRELAQAMPQIVFITDRLGVVEFVNQRWAEATGLPTELAIGSRWDELCDPADAGPAAQALTGSLDSGQPVQLELRLPHPDGTARWQLVRAVPNRDAAGQVVSWFGTSTDVHELKTAQERLQQQADEIRELNATLEQRIAQRTTELARQEALFRTLAEEAPLPIWTVDPRGRATFFSPGWYQLVGGEPPQWLGNGWLELLHPDDRAAVAENWRRSRSDGAPYKGRRRLRARDGTWHTTTYSARPVRGEDGQVAFWVGVDTDITDLIANEAALRLANEQLRSFSYTVSHDLQSPLQRIGSFAQLLQQDPALNAPGSRSGHYLQRIVANANEMVQMVQGLLVLSRVSQAEVVRRRVDISGMALEILDQLHADSPRRRVQWQVQPGLEALADTGLMRSVLENLLGNAWKFTSRTERAEIAVGRNADGEFFVRDNGAGFDMAHADKLFGTFERLHRQDEFPGTGIGLATVARAISRQGGRVWATATPGEGATFWFTLPAA